MYFVIGGGGGGGVVAVFRTLAVNSVSFFKFFFTVKISKTSYTFYISLRELF